MHHSSGMENSVRTIPPKSNSSNSNPISIPRSSTSHTVSSSIPSRTPSPVKSSNDTICFTVSDCEKLMEEYTAYEEKVMLGNVIQTYYFCGNNGHSEATRKQDEELDCMASEYGGKFTGHDGMIQGRRDRDYEFLDPFDGLRFVNFTKQTARFFIHAGLNVEGKLIAKPTRDEFDRKRRKLKEVNCVQIKCTP